MIVMDKVNPYYAVTLTVFAVYLLLALFGSRERDVTPPHRIGNFLRRLRTWAGTHVRR